MSKPDEVSIPYFNRKGEEITMDEWATLFEDKEYKVVRKTTVRKSEVSTVWLGSDHGYGMSDKPIIFETMVFGGIWDQFEQRYTTEKLAVLGHDTIVGMIEFYEGSKIEVEGWVRVKE